MTLEKFINLYSSLIIKYPSLKTLLISFGLLVFIGIFRAILFSNLNKRKGPKAETTLLKKKLTQYMVYFALLCLLLIWFSQLQVVLVSVFAIAAAIVIALKELIMCVTGGLLIKISKIFKVGHRIEIDGKRGFVIEKTLLTTKILEIGPEVNSQQTTGDIVAIPNSVVLAKHVKNESYFKGYSIKSFVFKIENTLRVEEFEKLMLEKAQELCKDYLEEAKSEISRYCEKEGLIIPVLEPRTKVIVEDGSTILVLVKIPAKSINVADIEQSLNRFYLDWKNQYPEERKPKEKD